MYRPIVSIARDSPHCPKPSIEYSYQPIRVHSIDNPNDAALLPLDIERKPWNLPASLNIVQNQMIRMTFWHSYSLQTIRYTLKTPKLQSIMLFCQLVVIFIVVVVVVVVLLVNILL